MDKIQEAKNWLRGQRENLDRLIAQSAINFHNDHKSNPNYRYDINVCNNESFRLSRGKDLCYDRYTSGLSYSTWYHGRRVNTFLDISLQALKNASVNKEEHIDIFDMGAGTGAVEWAFALSSEALKRVGLKTPRLRFVMLDASPFMLQYANKYLWPLFKNEYTQAQEIRVEYRVNSWINKHDIEVYNPWIVASYLFDHHENFDEITKGFKQLVEAINPRLMLLNTSSQSTKGAYLDKVKEVVTGINKFSAETVNNSLIYSGNLPETKKARNTINSQSSTNFSGNPNWDYDKTYQSIKVVNTKPSLNLSTKKEIPDEVNLYRPPVVIRREIELNEDQLKAAKPDERPTVIIGPAGCGKSVVITERIKNVCEKHNYSSDLSILVSTFNKTLMSYLGDWLTDILDSSKVNRKGKLNFRFKNSRTNNIKLLHFDVLPTRIWNYRANNITLWNSLKDIIENVVEEYIEENSIYRSQHPDYLFDPLYIYDEYHRVIYGLQLYTKSSYLNGDRTGRGAGLQKEGKSRKILWDLCYRFLKRLKDLNSDTFITIRYRFLKALKNGNLSQLQNSFSHIFVDEFQDCTQADYEIFYQLLNDPDQLVLAGDHAQAVHLGTSSTFDLSKVYRKSKEEMSYRNTHELIGSYRLPLWVSRAVQPLSEYIQKEHEDSSVVTPYKGAPPGSRPILVYAKNSDSMADKIKSIVDHYQLYDIIDLKSDKTKNITILEKDFELTKNLNFKKSNLASTDTILRLKGMEKLCVVWSTRISIEDKEEIPYFIYTILSRTAGLLIIALFDNMDDDYKKLLRELDRDYISFWDKNSEKNFMNKLNNK